MPKEKLKEINIKSKKYLKNISLTFIFKNQAFNNLINKIQKNIKNIKKNIAYNSKSLNNPIHEF